MNVKFSDIKRDAYGRIEKPRLLLKSRYGKRVGVLGKYLNLELTLKFNEVSELTFDLPAHTHGEATPFYDMVRGEAMIQLKPFGHFIIQEPKTSGDGVKEVKRCAAYSLEHELTGKNLSFAEGTYPFWNPVSPEETILGIALERVKSWKVGRVSPSLYNRYRTFDQTDTNVLDFLLGTAQESYGCVFLFDTNNRVVNVVDANEETRQLPVYMSYRNLLKEASITERNDNYATRVYVSGADGVDIRNVNPTGTNEIIHLGHPISMGDIPEALTEKYYDWKRAIVAQQAYYTGLVAVRNATYARYLTEKARLTDLEGELASLDNLRSVNVQGRAMATEYGSEAQEGTIAYFDARLSEIAVQYTAKEMEIKEQKALLKDIQTDYDEANADIKAVNDRLRFERYFTEEELLMLDPYLRDGFLSDSSFATFDVDVSGSNDSFTKGRRVTLQFRDVSVTDVEMTNTWECANHHSFTHTGTPDACPECGNSSLTRTSGNGRRIWAIAGGSLSVTGEDYTLSAPIISSTLDYVSGTHEAVFSAYLGSGSIGEDKFPSGNLSCAFTASLDMDALLGGMEKKVETSTDEETGVSREDITYEGDCTMTAKGAALYFTRNVTEYQRYSAEQELYNYAENRLEEIAYPVYEFSVEAGNFIWDERFEPFKNALQLGSAVYLKLDDKTTLRPVLLEVHLDYEKPDNFSLVFSSQYQTKRPDKVNKMKEILKEAQSTARTLDLGKHEFGKLNTSGAYSALESFLNGGLDAAYQQVTAGQDQNVIVDGSGISVKGKSGASYIKLTNDMIALIDDGAKTSRMAMGRFHNTSTGQTYYGVLADVIGGTLIAGKNLHMECFSPSGEVTQFKFDGTGAFLNNSRMYLQSDKGGRIGLDPNTGFIAGTSSLFTVTDTGVVHPSCLDDDGNLIFDKYGFPQNTNVYIGVDGKAFFRGDIYAENGFFNGILQAQDIQDKNGNSMLTKDGQIAGEYLDLRGVNIVNGAGDTMITIDETGMHFKSGYSPIKYQFSTSMSGPWHNTYATNDEYRRESFDGGTTWEAPYKLVGKDGRPGEDGGDASVNYSNIKSALQKASDITDAFMSVNEMGAPEIFGGKIYGAEIYAGGVGKKGGQVIGLTSSGIKIYDGHGNGVVTIQGLNGGANLTTGYNPLYLSTPELYLGDAGSVYLKGYIDFTGAREVDFSGVKTTGLHATFE